MNLVCSDRIESYFQTFKYEDIKEKDHHINEMINKGWIVLKQDNLKVRYMKITLI